MHWLIQCKEIIILTVQVFTYIYMDKNQGHIFIYIFNSQHVIIGEQKCCMFESISERHNSNQFLLNDVQIT